MARPVDANERRLNLIAYLDERRTARVTLDDIVNNVPGYDNPDRPIPRDPDGDLKTGTTEWESVRRKVRRDVKDISEKLRIDIAFNETEGSYRIGRPFFTPTERRALVAAASLIELEGFLPADRTGIGQVVGDDRAQIRVTIDDWFVPLVQAIEDRTPIRISYDGRERVVEPWFLGRWRTAWYLVAGDPDHDHQMRRFRMDRLSFADDQVSFPVVGEPGSYDIPDDVDAEEALDLDPNSWGPDPATEVEVRVAADHEYRFMQEFDAEIVERTADHVVARLVVRHRTSFVIRILAFRGQAVVLAPPDVRALVRDHLASTAGVA